MLPHQFRDDTPFPRQRNSPKRKGGNEKKQVGRLLLLVLLLLSCISRVQLCATPTDGSPPGSSVPGILQARKLDCVAISFSNA